MSVYWNKRVKTLSPYVPGEQPRDRKFIKLNTNENPYPPSPKVLEAIRRAAGEDLRLYPDPACTELREAVAQRYGLKPEQVFPGNGSDEVLAFAFAAFFESAPEAAPAPRAAPASETGKKLLFPDITYSFYPVYAGLWNVPFRTVPLKDDFSIDPGDYLVPSGGVIFPNPNAPTGLALPLEDVLSVAAFQGKQNQVVIVDEAYNAFGGSPALSAVKDHPNLLTVHTLSKAASLAGLRAGFAAGHEDLIEGLCRVRDSFNSYTMDRLAIAGAAAAVLDASYYEEINKKVIATRERVSAALKDMGFLTLPSSANFIFTRSPRHSGAELFSALRNRGILVRRFDKPRIADYLRVSMGTDGEMDFFLETLQKLLGEER
jgi:histidinol-phosphate aminotransferase